MRSGMSGLLSTDEAQHNVEALCHRFSALFAHLHREETELKAADARNALLERRLADLRQREAEQVTAGRAEVDGRMNEAAALRREVEAAERRSVLGGGEVDALAASVQAYARQAERLKERCNEEAAREREASDALKRRSEELSKLRQQRADLDKELVDAESGYGRVVQELQEVSQGTMHTCREINIMEQRVQEERRRCEVSGGATQKQREELAELDLKLNRAHADIEELARRLDGQRTEGRTREEMLQQHTERRGRYEDEIRSLTAKLTEYRKEGAECQVRLDERVREVQHLRERLRAETDRQHQEHQNAEEAKAKLEALRAEASSAERTLRGAEAELQDLSRKAAELEERCSAQRNWQDDMRQKHTASEVALERLREELRILSADRAQLQHDVDEVASERTRLDVEVQVTTPAVQDARRRCPELEERLAVRVRELGEEVEKVRRYRNEAVSAQGRLQVMERHNDALTMRLREQQMFDNNRAARLLDMQRSVRDGPPSPPRRAMQGPPPRLGGPGPGSSPARVVFDSISAGKDSQSTSDAVRFLCDFVAREEERLGLAPSPYASAFPPHSAPPYSRPSTPPRSHGAHTPGL